MESFDASRSPARFITATTSASLIQHWKAKTQSQSTSLGQIPSPVASPTLSPSPTCLTPVQCNIQQSASTPCIVRDTTSTSLSNQQYRASENHRNRRQFSDGSTSAILPPSPKRLKFIKNDIDEHIEKAKKGKYTNIPMCCFILCLGIMELPIKNLHKPPKDSRLLREPDNRFIKQLKEDMLGNPSAPGASTIAVLCKDITSMDQFEIKHKNVHR